MLKEYIRKIIESKESSYSSHANKLLRDFILAWLTRNILFFGQQHNFFLKNMENEPRCLLLTINSTYHIKHTS